MPETKRVAQNTKSYKFSAPQTPRNIQNSLLNRAPIPYDNNTNKGITLELESWSQSKEITRSAVKNCASRNATVCQ